MNHLSGRTAKLIFVAAIAVSLAVAACGSSVTVPTAAASPTPTPSPTPTASPSPTASPTPTPSPTPAASPSLPTQTATDWGRIWDAVPASFPVYPAAEPAPGTDAAPASATLTSTNTDGQAVATWYVTALAKAGYSTEALAGPLENGERDVDAHGTNPACQLQVRVTPLGDVTSIVVMFGASCPFR